MSSAPTPTSDRTPRRKGMLRAVWIVTPAVVFFAVIAVATFRKEAPPQPGDRAPSFAAPLLSGEGELDLADLRGKPVILNFWASWCPPCKDEAPMLRRAFERYGDRVAFVGVDIRDARSEALAFVEDEGLDYPSVRDIDARISTDYGLTGQPETFFIDSDGVIVEHVNGPLGEDTLTQLLDTLVARRG